jgi:hypothetical protein
MLLRQSLSLAVIGSAWYTLTITSDSWGSDIIRLKERKAAQSRVSGQSRVTMAPLPGADGELQACGSAGI